MAARAVQAVQRCFEKDVQQCLDACPRSLRVRSRGRGLASVVCFVSAPRLDPVAPVLTTLAQALHIQNTAVSPLLEPRLKATLGVHRSNSVARGDAQPAELQEHPSKLS